MAQAVRAQATRGQPVKSDVPADIKADKHRFAVTTAGARELVDRGHKALAQHDGGDGLAIEDADCRAQGGRVL